jgi:probable phosphoglycerate mutase
MIYLIRHGQTEYNLARRYQGALDSPLTALGRDQVARIGRRLADMLPPETPIVCSPLGRAQASADIIREAGGFAGPFTQDARIREISLGDWDGMTDEDIDFTHPGARDGTTRWNWHFRAPGGESHAAFAGRLQDWLGEALAGPLPLIAVSHGLAGRVLRGLYTGLDADEALRLDVPQDAFFRLSEGQIERIDAPPPMGEGDQAAGVGEGASTASG